MRWKVIGVLGLVFVSAFVIFMKFNIKGIIWDGGFPKAEIHISCYDQNNSPINNLELEVINESGHRAPFYPIAQFNAKVKSIGNKFVLNQPRSGIQFGGTSQSIFGYTIREDRAPQFFINIFYDQRVVKTIGFSDLIKETEGKDPETGYFIYRSKVLIEVN